MTTIIVVIIFGEILFEFQHFTAIRIVLHSLYRILKHLHCFTATRIAIRSFIAINLKNQQTIIFENFKFDVFLFISYQICLLLLKFY